VAAVSSLQHIGDGFRCTTPNCVNSCPFVYSFDGESYVRDAEVFGGAILEAAQHTDRAQLGQLATVDGHYRLRVANELPETDYIDALRLLVVDVPPSARVVASPSGQLLVLGDPHPAIRVRDLRGNDWTGTLARTDDQVWLSHPAGRDPDRPADLRDGLVMEFKRPPDARTVTLAFNARSTPWASRLLSELLMLHGAGFSAWQTRMNADAPARQAFFAALRREGLPSISIWDGTTWLPSGALVDLGPVVARDQALRVDITGILGETLRVRLDSAPGLWIVDSAVADFSAAATPAVQVLAATTAQIGARDVRGLLLEIDAQRLTLEKGEVAELSFPAVPASAGTRRWYFVEATGYYQINLEARGVPRRELFDRLINEPGAFSRFSLQMFANDLQHARGAAGAN
jgi:hypothetical protein